MKTYNYKIKKLKFLLFFLSVSFISQLNAQSITGFALYDATTNDYIKELENYTLIDQIRPKEINIVANTTGNVGSIVFYVDGIEFRTESTAPYTLAGDNAGDFYPWDRSSATKSNPTITAELYSEAGGNGTLLSTTSITVNIVDDLSTVYATDIVFNNCPTAPIYVGDELDLDITLFPDNVTNKAVVFSSDLGSTVGYYDGIFIANTPGEHTVYVTSFSDGNVFDTCTITVLERSIAFNNCPTAPLEVGETLDLDVTFFGDFTNRNVTFNSSGDGRNLNDITGEFSADTPGEYTVYVTSYEDGSLFDTCTITVVEPTTASITDFILVDADTGDYFNEINSDYGTQWINPSQPTNLNIVANTTGNVGSVVFYIDGNKFSTESVAPYALAGDNAGNFHTWDTSSLIDSSIITITGELYSEAGGNGTLLSTKSVILRITSLADYIYPLGMTYDCPTESIEVGETIDVGITLLPTNATEKSIKFRSIGANTNVSTIGIESFTFTAYEPGVYEVSGMSYGNGSLYETCTITVIDSTSNKSTSESKQSLDSFVTYPNPVVDVLNIQLNTNDTHNIMLFDLSGTKLIETSGVNNYGNLDLSNFESGVYILQIEQNGTISRNKILKK